MRKFPLIRKGSSAMILLGSTMKPKLTKVPPWERTMTKNKTVSTKNLDRRCFIGGSDARIIIGNDEAALVRLWREKRGEAAPPDYSDNLLVQLGLVTEPLNRRWYEKTTGQAIKDVQTWVRH